MNRPVSEILKLVPPYLYSESNPHGNIRICNAIERLYYVHQLITTAEAHAACDAVMDAVESLNFELAYLLDAAVSKRLLPPNVMPHSPEYVAFRDKWLAELIEAHRLKEQRP